MRSIDSQPSGWTMELHLPPEDHCSLADTAKELYVHVATVRRWRARCVSGMKLETIRIGGRMPFSRQALTE